MTARRLTVLGATGSIGASTLDVVERHPDRYHVHALTAHRSADALLALCLRHAPDLAVLSGLEDDASLRRAWRDAGCRTELRFGAAALTQVAAGDADTVMAAIVGAAGLPATLAAARAGKRILLANKEALVMAGAFFLRAVREGGATLLPIDSEHNAVFQCLPSAGGTPGVRRILLTASGGPFRTTPLERLSAVTPDEACAHPKWAMGRKISVDSATMMNKGLEVIEARWLFDLPPERIDVLIHPQSIVHSMVEYVDGSVLAQLSNPDMRVPIAHALGFPERIESGASRLDLASAGALQFEPPDAARFPCLGLAYDALRAGGVASAVLNAANEVAVAAFLEGRLRYMAIPRVIRSALERVPPGEPAALEDVFAADNAARAAADSSIARLTERAA